MRITNLASLKVDLFHEERSQIYLYFLVYAAVKRKRIFDVYLFLEAIFTKLEANPYFTLNGINIT